MSFRCISRFGSSAISACPTRWTQRPTPWHRPSYSSPYHFLVRSRTRVVVENYTYQAAQPFYNAMMPELAPVQEQGRLAGLGTALGYVGSIVGVLLVMPFFDGSLPIIGKLPESVMSTLHSLVPFTQHGGRVSTFVPTGLAFLLFSLPLIFFCRDHNPAPPGTRVNWRDAVREVAHTLRDARQHPGTLR